MKYLRKMNSLADYQLFVEGGRWSNPMYNKHF